MVLQKQQQTPFNHNPYEPACAIDIKPVYLDKVKPYWCSDGTVVVFFLEKGLKIYIESVFSNHILKDKKLKYF